MTCGLEFGMFGRLEFRKRNVYRQFVIRDRIDEVGVGILARDPAGTPAGEPEPSRNYFFLHSAAFSGWPWAMNI